VLIRTRPASLSPRAEQKALLATRASTPGDRRQLMQRKLAELDEQIARAQAARDAISHGLRCPQSHRQLHGQRPREAADIC